MLSIGVSSPDISMNIITKKNITKIACCIVSEMFASVTANPDMQSENKKAARKMTPARPSGTNP